MQCAVCSVPTLQSGGAASAAHLTRPRAYLPRQPPVLQKTSEKRNTPRKTQEAKYEQVFLTILLVQRRWRRRRRRLPN